MFHVPNKYRYKNPTSQLSSDDSFGNNGFFIMPYQKANELQYRIQASDGMLWEHVSVSIGLPGREALRCPTWEEMCYVKSVFWDTDDCVVQFHPTKSEYVNRHPYVLHLWRSIDKEFPIPDKIMVG
jgi:hypothetical protein